ncbi:hypothetical protein E2562_033227 [Oryza meyeriana var. granulata]|uniref:Uncharacterized protein n=1 Tax=Oryza meyeriana var. granulata TaxID=110450 RepID=A0A6G1BPZ4_9ORYZ|nr:hypothetical protein E2562_033227 [Oryza meyeriana var. granulata]
MFRNLTSALQQTVAGTCALVSTTKCVQVQHRWEYEALHGTSTFPCNAAAPRKLRRACLRKKIWRPTKGADVGDVLNMIQEQGGVRTTNGPTPAPSLLPVHSWQHHRWDHGGGLTADRIADLLDTRGPFVGVLWVCPWYTLFDSAEDRDLVYRSGCARDEMHQFLSVDCFGENNLGLHSVVCFGYRVCDGELHVLILDNHKPTGPERWIHFSELEEVFTISVKLMNPPIHQGQGGRPIRYPQSRHETD